MASLSPHRVENLPQKGRYRYPQPTVPEQKRVLLECPISQESPRIRSLVHVNDHKNRLSSVKMSRLAIYGVKLQIWCTLSCIELWISHVAAELYWLVVNAFIHSVMTSTSWNAFLFKRHLLLLPSWTLQEWPETKQLLTFNTNHPEGI